MAGSLREKLEAIAHASLAHVHGGAAVDRAVTRNAAGDLLIAGRLLASGTGIWIVAVGKAAAAMTRAVEKVAGEGIRGGIVVTSDVQTGEIPRQIPLLCAGHPVPDERSRAAAMEIMALVGNIPREDVLLVLLSGGASALTCLPDADLELSDLVALNQRLLGSGADIHEFNTVRKHCTALAGGRLAVAASCDRIEVLALSDVPGDRLETIGSGPCEGDPTTYVEALEVLDRFGLWDHLPQALQLHMEAGIRGEIPESPKPTEKSLEVVRSRIVACNRDARIAVVASANGLGMQAVDLGEVLLGEARDVGRRLAALARCVEPARPLLLVAGGETVVTLRGVGRGGRSQELALAAALEWAREIPPSRLAMAAFGTDGRDGFTDAAGAFVDSDAIRRERGAETLAREFLVRNDSHSYFEQREGLIRTGPTHTNVMDLVLILVSPPPRKQ